MRSRLNSCNSSSVVTAVKINSEETGETLLLLLLIIITIIIIIIIIIIITIAFISISIFFYAFTVDELEPTLGGEDIVTAIPTE